MCGFRFLGRCRGVLTGLDGCLLVARMVCVCLHPTSSLCPRPRLSLAPLCRLRPSSLPRPLSASGVPHNKTEEFNQRLHEAQMAQRQWANHRNHREVLELPGASVTLGSHRALLAVGAAGACLWSGCGGWECRVLAFGV